MVARICVWQAPKTNGAGVSPRNYGRPCPWGTALLLLLLGSFLSVGSRAQGFTLYNSGAQAISAGGAAYINPDSPYSYDWPMPYLDLDFYGLSCGDSVYVAIYMSYTDPNTEYTTSWEASQSFTALGPSTIGL
jgi:hypothetical protein